MATIIVRMQTAMIHPGGERTPPMEKETAVIGTKATSDITRMIHQAYVSPLLN